MASFLATGFSLLGCDFKEGETVKSYRLREAMFNIGSRELSAGNRKKKKGHFPKRLKEMEERRGGGGNSHPFKTSSPNS